MGRPTVMTDKILEKLEEAFLLGASDEEACFVADIAESTLYKYQEANPEFTERKKQLKNRPVYEARQSVIRHMKNNGELALKYLERKRKDEFAPRQEIKEIEPEKPLLGGDSVPENNGSPEATPTQ